MQKGNGKLRWVEAEVEKTQYALNLTIILYFLEILHYYFINTQQIIKMEVTSVNDTDEQQNVSIIWDKSVKTWHEPWVQLFPFEENRMEETLGFAVCQMRHTHADRSRIRT